MHTNKKRKAEKTKVQKAKGGDNRRHDYFITPSLKKMYPNIKDSLAALAS